MRKVYEDVYLRSVLLCGALWAPISSKVRGAWNFQLETVWVFSDSRRVLDAAVAEADEKVDNKWLGQHFVLYVRTESEVDVLVEAER